MRTKIILIIVLLVGSAAIFTLGLTHKQNSTQGNVTINLLVTDTNGIAATLNNETFTLEEPQHTYKLSPGTYTLKVNKPGFKEFSTQFNLDKNAKYVIDVKLELASDPTISNIEQVQIPGPSIPGAQITNTQYFYNKTWAVITLKFKGSDGVAVAKYDAAAKTWNVVLGPGTSFTVSDAQDVPYTVSSYLQEQGYLNASDQ